MEVHTDCCLFNFTKLNIQFLAVSNAVHVFWEKVLKLELVKYDVGYIENDVCLFSINP